jgi:hypothetical protein
VYSITDFNKSEPDVGDHVKCTAPSRGLVHDELMMPQTFAEYYFSVKIKTEFGRFE